MRTLAMKPKILSRALLATTVVLAGTVSAQTYTKTETITYHDNTSKWVLGQTAVVTCTAGTPSSTACDNIAGNGSDVVSATTYDATTALPLTTTSFDKLQSTATYNANGTLATIKDGNNKTTTFSNWKRGIPQNIVYADSTTQSAVVNDNGWIGSVTDENGHKTCYGYDAMGRISSITYTSESTAGVCDTSKWAATTRSFIAVASVEYGILAGHWRETVATGNAVKITYYDAMWRPLLVREYDASNMAGTQRFTKTAYDAEGRVGFAAYPMSSVAYAAQQAGDKGVTTFYDPLGRVSSTSQDSELGLLTTLTTYGTGFTTTVRNPRGFSTSSTYLTYDQPSTDWPLVITAPGSATTTIIRDTFGKPTSLTRSGGGVTPVVRSYAYNSYQELCRTVEPETGATLFGYDPGGNLTWSAAGLSSGQACSTTGIEAAIVARKASRTYDNRNRLWTLAFPDSNGNQTWTYTPDGLPKTVSTNNGGNAVTNGYTYNKRRLLVGESMVPDTLQPGWGIGYGYNALGQVVSEAYPASVSVSYTVNALGQTGQVTLSADGGAATTMASGASYFPNGALKQFTYGNGIVHTMTQNARQLPSRSTDGTVLDLGTTFDANGNVSAVTDYTAAARQTKSMGYDQLDRLTSTTSPMFGTASYVYDTLDNLKRATVSGGPQARDQYYCYDTVANTNRLTFVRSGPNCTGTASPAVTTLGYDVQGNLLNKNGAAYTFDYGNRLRTAAGLTYRYDADGRRVRHDNAGGSLKYSYYAKDGRLVWQRDEPNAKRISNVYLAGSLVAEYMRPIGAGTTTISYLHTDALGSPIAKTNSSGAVIETSEYEPYGDLLNRPNDDRAGYTGHVMDAASGLTYMQQRYYDPQIGRFLSVDPVTALSNPVGMFNRYKYAANNPYRFTDADGRYEEDVHRDLTAVLAQAAGASQEVARQIAAGDQGVDDDPRTSPMGMSAFGEAVRVRADFHFTSSERREEMYQDFKKSGSPAAMGKYLHAFQDSFSHHGYGARFGHLGDGHAPDKTDNDVAKADRMAKATYNTILNSRGAFSVGGQAVPFGKAVPWGKIAPLVHKFNAATTGAEKKDALAELKKAFN
jgi:RHS repeat-associated protein